jgi:hypothetical protein
MIRKIITSNGNNIIKITIIIIYIYYFTNNFKNNNYLKWNNNTKNIKLLELEYNLKKYHQLIKKPTNINDSSLKLEKQKIIELLSKDRNVSEINTVIFDISCCFGNCIIMLNKLLFYCEIIGCHYIVLNKNSFWFLKNTDNKKVSVKNF